MFLVTTADERTWGKDKKILFLGEWCKLFARKDKWSKLDYEVLPYHWDDCEKLHSDYLYLNDLYEKILPEISEILNNIHGVNHSVRYWRIIVGLWILGFIYVFYDRYQSMLSAVGYAKIKNTLIIKADRTKYVPQDFSEFGTWAIENDEYNYYLYSRIIEDMDRIPFEYLDFSAQGTLHIGNTTNVRNKPVLFKKIVKRVFQYMPQYFNKIVFSGTYLEVRDIIKLQFSLNQIPYFISPERIIPESKINLSLRNKIQLRSSDNRFQNLLMRMITEQLPTLYVEGYIKMNQIALKAYPKYPKIMFNSVAFNANETFKFWAAYNVDRDVKLLGCQHGGLYGSGILSASEDHQIKICNTFYTWGWESDSYKNTKSLLAAGLNTKKNGIRLKKGRRLLLVAMAMSRYSFIPETLCTSSSGFLAYLNEQYRFVTALSVENRKLLLVRLYMHDYQLSQKDRWISKFPEIECSDVNESIISQINKSSLCIITYDSTAYLETFVANFPTILFWNPKQWEARVSAKPYFDRLRKAGILYDTPEQAADKVNEISEDPISWWKQSAVQDAKDQFCHRFARTSNKWLEEWSTELGSQSKTG